MIMTLHMSIICVEIGMQSPYLGLSFESINTEMNPNDLFIIIIIGENLSYPTDFVGIGVISWTLVRSVSP